MLCTNGLVVRDYVQYLTKTADQRTPLHLYGKDMPCPEVWWQNISRILPPYLDHRGQHDLVSNLPEYLRPLSLMIYVGAEETWTGGHMDICGSVGHNIMLYADKVKESQSESACAVWFMTAGSDKDKAEEYWQRFG